MKPLNGCKNISKNRFGKYPFLVLLIWGVGVNSCLPRPLFSVRSIPFYSTSMTTDVVSPVEADEIIQRIAVYFVEEHRKYKLNYEKFYAQLYPLSVMGVELSPTVLECSHLHGCSGLYAYQIGIKLFLNHSCLAESSFIHEMFHAVDELVLGNDGDPDHKNLEWWGPTGDVEKMKKEMSNILCGD